MRWLLLIALAALLWFLLTRKAGAVSLPSLGGSPVADDNLVEAPPVNSDSNYVPGLPEYETPLNDIAQAIFQHEGKPGDLNYRNNNPGNLRSAPGQTGKASGYATFGTFSDGWAALKAWISNFAAKNPNGNFYDMFAKYAPAGDNNKPDAYADYVANYAGADPAQSVSSFLAQQGS
jgi:hypothetical protein